MLPRAYGQELSFRDSVKAYNTLRITVDHKGMQVLGAWGLANIAGGGVTYFAATSDEGRYFSAANVAWGIFNTGTAAIGLRRARKEMKETPDYKHAYGMYEEDRRFYLANAGLDVLYMAAGAGLVELSKNTSSNVPLYGGVGKSFVLQGIFLLMFDNFMVLSHQRMNSKWIRLMDEIRVTNNGIGINHTF